MKKLLAILMFLPAMAFANNMPEIPDSIDGNEESGAQYWTTIDTDGVNDDSLMQLEFVYGDIESTDFGMAFMDSDGNLTGMLSIFNSTFVEGQTSSVVFDFENNMVMTYAGSFDISDSLPVFAFYFTSGEDTVYSANDFNEGGTDYFGMYVNSNQFIGFDLTIYAVGKDGSTIQVGANDVTIFAQVPEPQSLAILALALMGFAFKRRTA
ncbi:PEP-CTERM sorting domain-containing protein [Thalassotalea ponticola]|uniref:PEP-CTERM sorting domain-containing protein n=1 Tax=Thalassotalea ponticola TaxID=1523392 RepID=UPI0025B347D0|nr:PEP-CTERM sorting domain-containing protein [Thalassotalea ponticola]MDN3653084.1 PEP-CTERM sorting domain-containing protein [Thalassotalea ponticola]